MWLKSPERSCHLTVTEPMTSDNTEALSQYHIQHCAICCKSALQSPLLFCLLSVLSALSGVQLRDTEVRRMFLLPFHSVLMHSTYSCMCPHNNQGKKCLKLPSPRFPCCSSLTSSSPPLLDLVSHIELYLGFRKPN